MIPIIALALAGIAPGNTAFKGVSVLSAADRTEIVIGVEGDVTASDFALTDPNRIVVDLVGMRPVTAANFRVDRGGIRSVRVAQYSPEIVRLVIDMTQPVEYRVERASGEVRLSFVNPGDTFEPWSSRPLDEDATLLPPETIPAPAATPPPAAPPQQQQLLTVTFTEEPVANVLAAFAEVANRSIVASADVKAKLISAEVRNQPWEVALEAILEANNMIAKELDSGVIVVEDGARLAQRPNEEPLESRQYHILYVPADSLVQSVQAMLTPQKGKASANKSSNTLMVTDVPSVLDQIEPLIKGLDIKVPQINIAATIAFVDRTSLEELGVTYDLKDSRGSQLNSKVTGYVDENGDGVFQSDEATSEDVILLGGNSIAGLANANFPVPNPALELVTSLVLGRHTLITFLDALQSVTLSDVQAKPVVTVMNHRQAEIQVGQRTPIRVIDLGSLGGASGQGQAPTATVDYQNTGVILKVTPHVTGDQVLLDIEAERSDAVPASSDIGFVFQTQNAKTQVLVRDGETTVIGGLTITEKSRVRTGIPLLMDLPVLGALFRNTHEEESKKDLLIMVTPHIVRE
ncbi:MAG: AMIN domain-containing protein [Gemmatimonadota bacterium]|jgi:type IV pilus assembly protein PilQ